jgi:tetratricopeptide (TPR) repeat protein
MLESTEEPRLTEVRALLQREYDTYRRAEALRRDLESAQRYLAEGNPEQAIAVAERLRPQHPDEPRIAELLSKARQAKEQQEQHIFLQKQLQRITALEQSQDWRGALAAAEEGLSRQPNAAALAAAVTRLKQKVAEDDRAGRIAAQAAAIRDVVSKRNFGKAEELLRAARKEFPGEPVFQSLTEQAVAAKRASEIDSAIGKIREAWRSGQLSSCRAQLATALATYPAEQRLVALEQEIASQIYSEATRMAQEELKRGHFDAAQGAVLRALEWRPQDPTATSLLNTIARERQVAGAVERIRKALGAGEYDECRDLIAAATKTYPRDTRITNLDEELKSRAGNASLASARSFLERGEHDAAESAARRVLTFRGDDQAAAAILSKIEAERQIATVLTRVEQARREGDAARSRELIAVALKKFPTEPRLISLAEQIQTDVFSQALNAARRDLEAGRIGEAEAAVNKALQLRPGDSAATSLLDSIQTEKDVAETLASARQAWRTGDLDKCRDILAAGLQRHPREERLRALETEFRTKVVADFVSAARNHLAQQRFDAAKQSANTALIYKPGDKEIFALVQTIANEQSIEDALTRTVSARRAGQFEKCLDVLKSALATQPSAERLLTLDREIREQGFNESIGLAREQLGRQRFDQAVKAAETALVFRPNDPTATGLIQTIRTEKDVEAAIEKSQAARRSGQFAKALEVIAAAPRSSMSEARLQQLADDIAQEVAREKEALERDQARRRAEEDERNRQAEARRRAEEEDRKRQEEERKREAEARNRAEEERKQQAEEESRRQEQARKRAAEEEARRRSEEEKARKKLDEEKARKKLEEDRARKQAQEEQERRKAEQESQRRAEEEVLRRKQVEDEQSRTRAAAASSTTILKTGTATPIEPAGAAAPPEQQPQFVAPRREPPKHPPAPALPTSKTPIMAGAAAAAALVIAVGVWWFSGDPASGPMEPEKTATTTTTTQAPTQVPTQQPQAAEPVAKVEPKPPELDQPVKPVPAVALQVMQSKLSFAWQPGTPPPAPQSFAINGSRQSFLATATSRWITVSPNRASAPRAITVSVRPGDLRPGSYSDVIRIAPTDNSFSPQNVIVELTVAPEAKPPEVAKQQPTTPVQQPPVQQPPAQQQPSQPPPVAATPSPAAQGKWLGASRGSITYSGDLPPGGRVVINTSRVIEGAAGDIDFSRTPPPFDAVRIEKTSAGVTATPRGYDLVITNTSGSPMRLVQIEWSYQPKR